MVQFDGLDKLQLGGELFCTAEIIRQDRQLNFQIESTADNLLIAGLAPQAIREPQMALNMTGSITQDQDNKPTAISIEQAKFVTNHTQLDFSGQGQLQPVSFSGQAKINSNLAKLNPYLVQFDGLDKLELAGQLRCTTTITRQGNGRDFQTNLTADNLVIAGLTPEPIQEQQLTLDITGSAEPDQDNKIAAVSIKRADLLGDRTHLQFSGQVTPKPLGISGQAEIDADLARVQQLALALGALPTDLQLQGQLHSTMTLATSQAQTISSEGTTNIDELNVKLKTGQKIHQPNVNLQHRARYNLTSKKLDAELPKLQLTGLTAQVEKLTLTPQPDGESDILVNANFQADLNKIRPLLVTFAEFDPTTDLTGQATGQASYWRKAQQDQFSLSSDILNLELRPSGKPVVTEPKISVRVQGSADQAAKTIELDRLHITSTFLQADAQITSGLASKAAPAKITLRANCDLKRLSLIIQPWRKNWPDLQGSATARANLTGTAPSDPARWLSVLSGTANVQFDQQSLSGLTFGPAEVDMQVKQGLLTIPPTAIPANEGKINVHARIFLDERKPFLTITQPINLCENVQINPEMSNTLLKFVNPLFANNNKISGTVNFTCNQLLVPELDTWKETAKMKGLFSGKDLRFESQKGLMADLAGVLKLDPSSKLGELKPVSIELANGVISYRDMHILFGSVVDLSFAGEVGLDERIRMQVGIPILPSMLGNRPELINNLGSQRIYLPMTGTLSKPRLDVGSVPELLFKQLPKVIEKEATKQIEKILEGLLRPPPK